MQSLISMTTNIQFLDRCKELVYIFNTNEYYVLSGGTSLINEKGKETLIKMLKELDMIKDLYNKTQIDIVKSIKSVINRNIDYSTFQFFNSFTDFIKNIRNNRIFELSNILETF
jgi:uncharacterized protein YbcV (DUF1398 family)